MSLFYNKVDKIKLFFYWLPYSIFWNQLHFNCDVGQGFPEYFLPFRLYTESDFDAHHIGAANTWSKIAFLCDYHCLSIFLLYFYFLSGFSKFCKSIWSLMKKKCYNEHNRSYNIWLLTGFKHCLGKPLLVC